MAQVRRGDKGKYVPHQGHWNDWANREPCFHFVHDDESHSDHEQEVPLERLKEARPRVAFDLAGKPMLILGANEENPIKVKVSRPRQDWDAVVVGVWPDGTVTLLINHPDSGQGVREYQNVPVVDKDQADKPLHSFYVTDAANYPAESKSAEPTG